MPDYFIFSINVYGSKKDVTIKLLPSNYVTRVQVLIDNDKLFFEPDEEGQYRLIKMPWQNESEIIKVDTEIIQQIISLLHDLELNL